MVKIKNSVISGLVQSGSLAKLLTSTKLPVKVSWELSKLSVALRPLLTAFNSERQKIIGEFSRKDEKGRMKVLPDGMPDVEAKKMPWLNKKMNDFLELESELQLEKIEVKLEYIPDDLLSPADFANLSELIDFKE